MALWRYTLVDAQGHRETNVLVAGNAEAARTRAERNASARGARLIEGPTLLETTRGSP